MGKLFAVLLCLSAISATAAPTYEKAKLLEVRPYVDKDIVGGGQSNVVTVVHDMYEITVQFRDLALTGLAEKKWKWSFDPGTFVVGDPLEVRLEGKNFFIKRSDGKELKAHIIRRERLETPTASAEQPSHSK